MAMTNPSPHFDFHSTVPVPPIDDSLLFSSKFSLTLACEEPSEDAAITNTESASGSSEGSASPLKEAGLRGRKSGRNRGGGGGPRKKSKHPVYKGVRKRQEGKWVSEIREPGKKYRIWLGTFPTPDMAARAYDVAAFNLIKPYAYLNFPEAVSSLPVPLSCSPKSIQAAASMAAAVFRGAASSSHATKIGGFVPTSQVDQISTFLSTSMPMQEQNLLLPQSTSSPTTAPSFFDEDLIFDMPNVLANMAEGLIITPPLLYHGTDADNNFNIGHGHIGAESSLWSI